MRFKSLWRILAGRPEIINFGRSPKLLKFKFYELKVLKCSSVPFRHTYDFGYTDMTGRWPCAFVDIAAIDGLRKPWWSKKFSAS